jgi:hypothetical protein
MTTAELINALQEADPSGQRTVCIDAVGFRGGIGNHWANLPRVERVHKGFDWESCMVKIRPTEKLTRTASRVVARNAKQAQRDKKKR